ncbi:MAG TPA: hypothetical protein VGS57_02200 [Thermoanaerobaculia bacterium]|jgi:hypothetical protein|nr:hypothetical protein [Thermoanaerobaculia bacterium]
MREPVTTVRVSSLLGHGQVELAILCLGSLLRFAAEPLALRLHDDGSLTAADAELLRASLGDVELVWRRQADERIEEELARYPVLRGYRRQSALALKLLDAPLWAVEELCYCDTDVLFFRPFRGLFARPEGAGLFMTDRQNAYSVRSWHLLRHRRLRLVRRLNSGVIAMPRERLDLDLLEWFLGHAEFRFAPVWVEQTGWALLARRGPCRLLSARQLVLPAAGGAVARDCVGAHFVGAVRGELPRWRRELEGADPGGAPPEALRSHRAGACTAVHLAVSEARRVLARRR